MAGLVEGKVALVTGGGSGIGQACARIFVREGADVVVADTDERSGERTVASLCEAGGKASFVRCDVGREEDVEAMIRHVLDTRGRLDCAVNNAGITGATGMLHEISLEGWSRTLTTNLTGVFLCLRHELPVMQRQGGGAIVNMSSGAGLIPTPGLAPYCASKHGVLGLTKTAAVENVRTGVRVNAICPGSVDTPMLQRVMNQSPVIEKLVRNSLPGGRLAAPEEIAEAAVWLCCDRASFVSGESMLVDAGAVAR